jgi:hypothetical protein
MGHYFQPLRLLFLRSITCLPQATALMLCKESGGRNTNRSTFQPKLKETTGNITNFPHLGSQTFY